MTEYLTEQEQIEQLKRWLRAYGLPALLGVFVGIVLFYGWHYYQGHRLHILTRASSVYDEMLTNRVHHNQEGAITQANKLLSHYASTPYGELAAFMLAHEAITQKNYPEALKHLSWVMKHSHTRSLRQIARLRVARIYIANQHPEEAIHLLRTIDDKSFSGLIDEVLGDAYLAAQQPAQARAAYQAALQNLPHSEEMRPLLEMKRDNLITE